MYISKLHIENWKNFKTADVQLGYRVFLVGPNASGKSNFLDVLRFLRELCISGGGLQQAVDVSRNGVSAIRSLSARRYPDIVIDVEMREDTHSGEMWRYLLSFTQDNNRRPLIKREIVERDGLRLLDRPNTEDKNDSLRLTETSLEQTSANRDFRPVVQFFQSISYQHLLPQVIRDPQGFSPSKVENDPFGRDFLQRVENTTPKARDARLRKILAALQVAVPKIKEIRTSRDAFGVPHLVGVYEHWRANAGRQDERQFSDGTLRLFGLLWTMFEGSGPLLMEEPELSLHEAVVRHLPRLIEQIHRERRIKRQVFISTHSEAMLSDKGIGGREVLRLEPGDEGTSVASPADDPDDNLLLESGLTVADVVLPKSAPRGAGQLAILFDR